MLIISNNLNPGFPGSRSSSACVSLPGSPYLRTTMKTCSNPECGKTKPLSEFSRDKRSKDGLQSRCKACRAAWDAAYHKANRQIIRDWMRLYYENNRERIAEYRKNYRRMHAKEHSARDKAKYAIRAGKLVAEPCESCGAEENVDAHHDDYSKPLDVRWLCRSCHTLLHAQLKITGTCA